MESSIVWITGASSGIGAEMAREVAKRGHIPILTARSLPALQQIARSIPGPSGVYQMDVTQEEDVTRVVQQIMTDWKCIDVCINNAGFGVFKSVEETTMEEIQSMMNVNYTGLVRCTKAVLPAMRSRGKGHVINIASLAGKVGTAKSAGYAATKHAVIGFSSALRQELRGSGIRVSLVNPGPIETPFFHIADPDGTYVNNLPKWMLLKPEKVAQRVVAIIGSNRLELNLPFYSGWAAKFALLFPRFFDRWMSRMVNRK
ncbi:SDR family NAD(P)-dependent oxidoreductase [Marinicrinis sediminis]|uniref:SDR family NAD(P)-dependent oxidoreductase n=1 Tax=Marinicrinis sediminis TaxID=1652465 RepID=A0ABW5R946_9BACL